MPTIRVFKAYKDEEERQANLRKLEWTLSKILKADVKICEKSDNEKIKKRK